MIFPPYGWATKWHHFCFCMFIQQIAITSQTWSHLEKISICSYTRVQRDICTIPTATPIFLTWSSQGNISRYRPGMGMAAEVEKLVSPGKITPGIVSLDTYTNIEFYLHKICCIILFLEKNNPPIFGTNFLRNFRENYFWQFSTYWATPPPPKKKIGPIPKNHFWQFFSTPFWPRPKNVFVQFSESSPIVVVCYVCWCCYVYGSDMGAAILTFRAKPHLVASSQHQQLQLQQQQRQKKVIVLRMTQLKQQMECGRAKGL